MKKNFLIASLIVLGMGATATFLHARTEMGHMHENGTMHPDNNMRCFFCKGTGFQGNTDFNCTWCKGTGRNSNY